MMKTLTMKILDDITSPVLAVPIGIFGLLQPILDIVKPVCQIFIMLCSAIVIGHSAYKVLFGGRKKKKKKERKNA